MFYNHKDKKLIALSLLINQVENPFLGVDIIDSKNNIDSFIVNMIDYSKEMELDFINDLIAYRIDCADSENQ